MWFFWVFAFVPIIAGLVLVFLDCEVDWREWLLSCFVALLMAGGFQLAASFGMTADIETWSGHVLQVEHHPQWVERWIETHSETYQCGTDSKGNAQYCTRTWTTTEYDTHYEHWESALYFGADGYNVNVENSLYEEIKGQFGNRITKGGKQPYDHGGTHYSGDNNIYVTPNDTHFIRPVTTTKLFKNKIKAAPSLFSYTKVPTNIAVYAWPKTENTFLSDRVMGTALTCIHPFKWDQMNAVLGPEKKVNLIIIGFGNKPTDMADWQEASWIGGKKNDLVICYGGGSKTEPATWVKVFGWTEKNIVKEELASLMLEMPINDDLLPKISEIVARDYVIKDWHKFDYITIEPPAWSYWVYLITMVVVQGGLYFWFHINELNNNYKKSWYGDSWLEQMFQHWRS